MMPLKLVQLRRSSRKRQKRSDDNDQEGGDWVILQQCAPPPPSPNNDQSEHISALEAQVQLYANDLKLERQDREAAQSRAIKLEEELNLVRIQLNALQETTMTRLHNNRMAAMTRLESNHISCCTRDYGEGNIECDNVNMTKDEDIIDSLTPVRVAGGQGRLVADGEESSVIEDNMLQCNKCNTKWNAVDHVKFLEHINTCVSN